MRLFEVAIVRENYDEKTEKTTQKFIWGPAFEFAYSAKDAIKKVVIKSRISPNDIDSNEMEIYVREFPNESEL